MGERWAPALERKNQAALAGAAAYRCEVSAPSRWLVLANLWIVYVVWGSTYLAIRVAVETVPPLLGAGIRFVAAGLILAVVLRLRGHVDRADLGRRQLVASAVVGTLLLVGGNGLVMTAEQTVPSGLAALIVASIPLWVVVLRTGYGQRVSSTTRLSVAIGLIGVAILVLPKAQGGIADLIGPFLLVVAAVSWTIGSFFAQRLPLPRDPLVSTTLEQLFGGILLAIGGLALGDGGTLVSRPVSSASLAALAYLVVFGSLVAFSAYTWLLHHAPVSTVATYAYVNPVIAVFLGWALLHEDVTVAIVAGAVVIVASVALVVRQESLARPRPVATSGGPAAAATRRRSP
jgi:drug/metabolite transporter (DMT)-like permease